MSDKLKLGLIIDPEFYMLERSVCALTPQLIRAFCRTFDTRIIWDQRRYDELCTEVDFLVSFEPKFAAPLLKWQRVGLWHNTLPACPCYVMMSDPHNDPWRESYFLSQGLDFILGLYYHPTLRHFTQISPSCLVHFPWPVPEQWINTDAIRYRGQQEITIFGAAQSDAYTVRNWCRQQPGVHAYANSGVENKTMDDQEFFVWLQGFDAVIAAGSEDPRYRLTTPKYFETAAAGSLLFAQATDDLERLGFRDEVNCLVFTQATFSEKAAAYLANPANERYLRIRHAGRDLILARHTIQARLQELDAHVRSWKGR